MAGFFGFFFLQPEYVLPETAESFFAALHAHFLGQVFLNIFDTMKMQIDTAVIPYHSAHPSEISVEQHKLEPMAWDALIH